MITEGSRSKHNPVLDHQPFFGKQGYALAEAAIARGDPVHARHHAIGPAPARCREVVASSPRPTCRRPSASLEYPNVVIMASALEIPPQRVRRPQDKTSDSSSVRHRARLTSSATNSSRSGHSIGADQIIVGFAAETDNVMDNARGKLARKNLDLIVANDVSAPNVGFAHETNEVTILPAHGDPQKVSLTSKRAVADRILDAIVQQRSRQ